jgi:Ferritin-like domain
MGTTRRELLGRGAGIAGVAALPASLLAAPLALAQESDETDALERIIGLEQAAELAYSLAAEDGNLKANVTDAFERFSTHCGEHATALSEALDQLGVDPPDAGSAPADYERLADFDASAPQKQQLRFMTDLEEELIQVYQDEIEALEAEDLVRSAAQIGASHAQMWVELRTLADGRPPAPDDLP